jgi:hypothetical protein
MPNRMVPRLPSPISLFFADRFRVFDRYSPPTTTNIRVLVFALVLLVLAVETDPVSAQAPETAPESEVGPLVTDRPTDSASPLLVPRHAFQLEAGYKLSRVEEDSGDIETHVFPDLLLRYGINRKVEARLVAAGWTIEDAATRKEEGLSDVSLGAKFALGDERGRRPQMGLLVDVSLPVGDSDITNDYVIPKVLFLASNTLTDRLAVTYNLGPSIVMWEDNGERQTDWDFNYAAALGLATGGPVSLFGEFYGALLSGSGRDDRHNFQLGGTLLLSSRLQIDLRGGLGLVDHEPDWLVGAGLAFRLPY